MPDSSATWLVLLKGTIRSRSEGKRIGWDTPEALPGVISLPRVTEPGLGELKIQYLRWIHDLGRTETSTTTVRRRLMIRSNLSFWWLTHLAKKCTFDTPQIHAVFKLRKLEEIYRESKAEGIVFAGRDPALEEILSKWMRAVGGGFRLERSSVSGPSGIRRILDHFKSGPLGAWCYLFYFLATRWRVARRRDGGGVGNARTLVATYFPNYDPEAFSQGTFRSNYFGPLNDEMRDIGDPLGWIWLYARSAGRRFRDAVEARDRLTAVSPQNRSFSLMEEALTSASIRNVRQDYRKVCNAYHDFSATFRNSFRLPGSAICFYPLYAQMVRDDFTGKGSMQKLLMLAATETLAQRATHVNLVLYVWEGQPWEVALLSAFRRKARPPRLIGHQHATIPPLDFMPFQDRAAYQETGEDALPLPDTLVVDGPAAENLMRDCGFPKPALRRLEALRYQHLQGPSLKTTPLRDILLVITGYVASEVQRQIEILNEWVKAGIPAETSVVIKPHPFCSVDAFLSPKLKAHACVTPQPLHDLLPSARHAFVSAMTSAVLETILSGIPTALMTPGDALSLSPAWGMGLTEVGSAEDLKLFLADAPKADVLPEFFTLGTGLSGWRELLWGAEGNLNRESA